MEAINVETARTTTSSTARTNAEESHVSRTIKRVFTLLRFTFGIVPIVAGLDKFTNLLTPWENYLHPSLASMLPFEPHTFMMIVGVIEIAAGVLVLVRPAIGGYVVAAWLSLIALSLLASGFYLDVAVRDLVMAIAVYSLARLANIATSKLSASSRQWQEIEKLLKS
jgi:hypothetical protein